MLGEIRYFNSLPKDKILDQSKFKAFADDEKNVIRKIENIVQKGENAVNYAWSLSQGR